MVIKIKQLKWGSINGPYEYWYASNSLGAFSVIERRLSPNLFDIVITINADTTIVEATDANSGKRIAQEYFEKAVLELIDHPPGW